MSYEGFQFPTGQTNAQLYQHCRQQTTQLRAILQQLTGGADTDLTAILADIASLQADVIALQGAGGSLTVQQAFELSLVTDVDSVFGSLAELRLREQTSRENEADATILAAINANKANVGITNEVRVRNEADLALAQQITAVNATLGVTNANVTTLTQAVATGDQALGAQISTVTSQVAGNTASISVLTTSVNGVNTRFAVQLNNQNEVTGFIRLDGGQSGSAFTVAADNFFVSKVGTGGGAAVPVFAISTVSGNAKLALRGDMITDGSISARTIAAGAVTADKIVAGAVTADKVAVNALSAFTANLGTVTAGLIRDANDTLRFDLPNMRLYRADGTMELNFATKFFRIIF